MPDKFTDHLSQRAFAEQNHPLQARFPDGSDEALRVSIQVRRTGWQLHRFDTTGLKDLRKLFGEQRVPIVNQVALPDQEAFRGMAKVVSNLTRPKVIRLPRHSGDFNL